MKRVLLLILLLVAKPQASICAESEVQLRVEPSSVTLSGPRDRWQLLLTAKRGDQQQDITRAATYEVSDSRIAVISKHGLITPRSDGTTKIVATWQDRRVEMDVQIRGSAEPTPSSFRYEVLPALTSAGCNAGKCHGSPSGKGGFALSLRGYDADADVEALVRQHGGRRINPLAPDESLLLLKPTTAIPHGGGKRLATGDARYAILRDWIAGRAPIWLDEPRPKSIAIAPAERYLEPDAADQQIVVTATWPDGLARDVTHLAHLSTGDTSVAEIDGDGYVSRATPGEVTVSAQFAGLQATSTLYFLRRRNDFRWSSPPESHWIDSLVFAKLRRLRIMPADLASDAEFLRRATLDVCGVTPTAEQAKSFLDDPRTDKRDRLIDELLERPEYADYWGMKWADRLGCNQRFVGHTGAVKYFRWIRNQVATNVPEDEFARRLVTASGGNYGHPAASFYRLPRTPQDRAEHVSQVLLGVRIGCARCHNHPGERWSQDDYYSLAAYFAQIKYRNGPFFNHQYDKEETIVPMRDGELSHPRTGDAVSAKPLNFDGETKIGKPAGGERRAELAAWLTSPENRQFARAAVNRIWHQLFGRGLVEPVDDFRSSNPASHPQLLERLAEEFARGGFNRKELIHTIMRSRTYQLAARGDEAGDPENRYFGRTRVRPLEAEQLLDSISRATGVPEPLKGYPVGLRAAEVPDGEFVHRFLTAFGRPARALSCACERESETTVNQALELVGGRVIEPKLRDPNGRLAKLLAAKTDPRQLVEELYLATLTRRPTHAEIENLAKPLTESPDAAEAAQDLFWALLNHREFVMQH
jgi:hypothetical protein